MWAVTGRMSVCDHLCLQLQIHSCCSCSSPGWPHTQTHFPRKSHKLFQMLGCTFPSILLLAGKAVCSAAILVPQPHWRFCPHQSPATGNKFWGSTQTPPPTPFPGSQATHLLSLFAKTKMSLCYFPPPASAVSQGHATSGCCHKPSESIPHPSPQLMQTELPPPLWPFALSAGW